MSKTYEMPFYLAPDEEWKPDGSGITPFSLRNQVQASLYLAPDGRVVDYFGNPVKNIRC